MPYSSLPFLQDKPDPIHTQKRTVGVRPFLALLTGLVAAVLTFSPTSAEASCSPSDTLAAGQQKINQGQYEQAIEIFTCVMAADPLEVDAYRGRSEAKLMLNQFSDAYRDMYAFAIASLQPASIVGLGSEIIDSYDARLAAPTLCSVPTAIPCVAARSGASFVRWAYFDYGSALPLLEQILQANPNSVYGKLFRGSNRMFAGGTQQVAAGKADLDAAIALAPSSAHVRYIVADAWAYHHLMPSSAEIDRAYDEAALALSWGLDTPRIRAILAAGLNDLGDWADAAAHIQTHINQSTLENVTTAPLGTSTPMWVDLVPWRTYNVPVVATAGQHINVSTDSTDQNIWDTILVLLDPNGVPIVGFDDDNDYYANVDWVAQVSGTYTLRVTSFEAVSTGPLKVKRN